MMQPQVKECVSAFNALKCVKPLSTTRIARDKNAQGFIESKEAAKKDGTVAGVARKELEQQSIRKVSASENHLSESEKKKKLEDKSKK